MDVGAAAFGNPSTRQQHPGSNRASPSKQFRASAGHGDQHLPTADGSSAAFAELDPNQDPIQRARTGSATGSVFGSSIGGGGGKDASSMADQHQQQPPAGGGDAATAAAAPPAAAWASFLTGFQQQAYVSPGARAAAGRRGGQQQQRRGGGATPRASRMQHASTTAAAAGSGAAAAGPTFAFGSPMQGSADAAGAGGAPAAAGGAAAGGPPVRTPASLVPPGTAMSTDTAMPADFTAAFSAMSVDTAATPSLGSNSHSAGQPWAFRGPRAAAVTGKRLFDTPSSAGGAGGSAGSGGGVGDSSTPSPFGSWGRASAGAGGAGGGVSPQQQGGDDGGSSRVGAVPFPGFGSAMQDGAAGGSPAGAFAFNPGKPSPGPRGKGNRQQRSSPARKPPPAPSFAGFGSPAFSQPAAASRVASGSSQAAGSSGGASTPSAASFGAPAVSSSGATPAVPSAGSFQGFFGGAGGPGSAATTPGFSPMMWSPATEAPASPQAPFGGADPAAAATAGGVSFEAVNSRQEAAATSDQQTAALLQQAQRIAQQQAEAAELAAEIAAAAAVDLPSDESDSAEDIAELLTDLSTSGDRPAQGKPEAEAVAGLRAAVEQLSTAETQQQQAAGQPQPAVPSFVFGSPDTAATTASGGVGVGRSNSSWLTSPQGPSVVPTTLFDMSPLKASLDSATAPAAAPASTSQPQQQPAPAPAAAAKAAAGSSSSSGAQPPPPVFGATAPAAAAGAFGIGAVPPAAAGGFSFTPGKASKASSGRAGRKPTPVKLQRAPEAIFGSIAQEQAAAQFSSHVFPHQPASVFGGPAAAAPGSNPFAQQPQQQHYDAAGGAGTPGSRRKVHATQRRTKLAGVSQQQQSGSGAGWPSQQQQQPPWPPGPAAAAAVPNLTFTLGSSKPPAGSGGSSTPARSPRKGGRGVQQPHARQQQQQQPTHQQPQLDAEQQAAARAAAAVQQAVQDARACCKRAQMCWDAGSFQQAEAEFTQGITAVASFAKDTDDANAMLSTLYNHRASARLAPASANPVGALQDALKSISNRKKFIEGYLRAATCLVKLGCLTAADRVLDKALDMISAGHSQWRSFNSKRQQVQQLLHKQQRVVAAALGCSPAAAEAALAAASAGQHLAPHLEGFVSVSPRPGSSSGGGGAAAAAAAAAAATALADGGSSALEDADAAKELLAESESVVNELTFWEDATALHAWLLLRSGQLDKAAAAAREAPNSFFARLIAQQQQQQHNGRNSSSSKSSSSSKEPWGWRWWVLAQVSWHQGDLSGVQKLLLQGKDQLAAHDGGTSGVDSSSQQQEQLWRLLLPSLQELSELQAQTQQLLSLKEAGNAAIQSKQYDKAAEEYSRALALQPSCGFAAVIHSNRAAAYQQQKRLVEALADCSRAVALDPRYARAYLRMAQILEALHRADRAVVVLQDALKGSANAVDPATTRGHELTHGASVLHLSSPDRRKFEDMLATAQVAARRFKTPHHYKALGLTMTASEADIRKAYRGLALKHHPDKALQHCRWSSKLGRTGAAAAHVTCGFGGIEASLKAAANEVFGFLSAAHEDLTNSTARSKLDRDLRTEEQLYSNNHSSSSSSRPASYTYSYGARRDPDPYNFDDFFRRTAAAGAARQQQQRGYAGGAAAGGGSSRPAAGGGGGGGYDRWYQRPYWAQEEDDSDDEDDAGGYGYRSKY